MSSILVQKLRPSIARILVTHKDPSKEVFGGTGFFIAPDKIVTCAHVVLFHPRLDVLLQELNVSDKNGEAALQKHFTQNIEQVMIEVSTGERKKAESVRFNAALDIAVLTLKTGVKDVEPLGSHTQDVSIGDEVFFGGFPYVIQTPTEDFPFAVHKGHINSFPALKMGGYKKKEMMQIQMMALGGASGAPIFSAENGALVGMVNGHMTWGADRVAIMKNDESSDAKFHPDDLYIPLPVVFGSPIEEVLKTAKDLLK